MGRGCGWTVALAFALFAALAVAYWPLQPPDPVEGPYGYLECGGSLPVLLGNGPPEGTYDDMIIHYPGIEPAPAVNGDAEAICRSAATRRVATGAVALSGLAGLSVAGARHMTRRST